MVIKIDEPSAEPIADLNKSYKKQNEQIIMARYLARTPDNDIYMLEPTANQGIHKISIGSVIEFAGTLYQVLTDPLNIIAVSGLKDGDCYIKLKIESDTIKAYITNEKPPAFDFVKKGHYKIESSTLVKFLSLKIFRKAGKYVSTDKYDNVVIINRNNIKRIIFDTAGTHIYTPSLGVTRVRVEIYGGGGEGASNNATGVAGGNSSAFGFVRAGGKGGANIDHGGRRRTGGGSGSSTLESEYKNGRLYGQGGTTDNNGFTTGAKFGDNAPDVKYSITITIPGSAHQGGATSTTTHHVLAGARGSGTNAGNYAIVDVNPLSNYTIIVGDGGKSNNPAQNGSAGAVIIEEYV